MAATETDKTAIETLRSLGFRGEPTRFPAPDVRFTRDDCALFGRYPKSVPWKDDYVDPADQSRFRSIWERLKRLAEWLALEVDNIYPPMKWLASRYQANGRSQADIWCCIFPSSVVNKSYALQVALIISADGAEVCLCLGAGRSAEKEPRLSTAQNAFRSLQSCLASVPPDVVQAVEGSLPSRAVLRTSWREPGESEFRSVREWAAYAGGPEGAQASISVFLTAEELELLADQIANVLLEMAQDAAPLFAYCYHVVQAGEARAEDPEQAAEPCGRCRHPRAVHGRGTGQCSAPGCAAGPDGAPCPGYAAVSVAPWVDFDADALEQLARDERGLELDPDVYRAVVAAIRSGKHVILTGPPGTAKTTLAEMVCILAGDAGWCSGYALTTATSDWTTYDTIGGLRPAGSGSSLKFHDGIVLEAVRKNQWVIIDELNRSNFDRAFGQLFTVLSGQPVVLPYEDPDNGRRIVLCPAKAAGRNYAEGYEQVLIPKDWRIVATMNVFDKSLLFEMSFALMRRFAFVEVPSPEPAVFATLWNRDLDGLPEGPTEVIGQTLTELMALRPLKDIGPAVFLDMARFAVQYLSAGDEIPAGQLAFQLFYSYLLPQYEGITQQQGQDLLAQVLAITGPQYQDRLTSTLNEVLGINVLPEPADGSDDGL
jgi:MoxR-like ATPase